MSLRDILPGAEVDAHVLDANFKELSRLITEETLNRKTAINNLEGTKANNIDVAKISERSNTFNVDNVFNKITTFNDNVLFNNTKETDEEEDITTTFETKVVFNNKINAKNKVIFEKEIELTDEMYSVLCTKMMPNLASNKNDRMPKTVYAENQNGYLFVQDGYSSGVYWSLFIAIKDEKPTEGKEVTWYKYNFDNLNSSSENRVLCIPIANKFQYKILRVDKNGDEVETEFPTNHFKQLYFIPCIGG